MGLSIGEIPLAGQSVDGLPDLFITHWIAEENAFYHSQLMDDGLLEYRDKTRDLRLGENSLDRVGWGCGIADFDLDGRFDLVVANGSTLENPRDVAHLLPQELLLLWNDGKAFWNVAADAGPEVVAPRTARGLAVADYDGDGDPDFAVSVNRGPLLLFRNDAPRVGQALRVRLCGPAAACWGAKVQVERQGRTLRQWFGADVSFLSAHAPELIFGMGDATEVERVHVRWADGAETELRHVGPGVLEAQHPDATGPAADRRGASREHEVPPPT
jgi:hypothetical protein